MNTKFMVLFFLFGTASAFQDSVHADYTSPEDTVILKTGKVYTGTITMETPRVVTLSAKEMFHQFKRHLVRDIRYFQKESRMIVKYRDERNKYMRYENSDAELDLSIVKPSVAVNTFHPNNITSFIADYMTEAFREHLLNTGRFDVLKRFTMTEILKSQNIKTPVMCTSIDCAVELGRQLGVDFLIVGNTGISQGTWFIILVLVDTRKELGTKYERTENQEPKDEQLKAILKGLAGEISKAAGAR